MCPKCKKECERTLHALEKYYGRNKSCGCFRLAGMSITNSKLPPLHAANKRRIVDYRRNAEKRGIAFDLTDDFCAKLLHQNCHYCGAPPGMPASSTKIARHIRVNGIDRIDNTISYKVGNVVACCKDCNRAKWEMSASDFSTWLQKAYRFNFSKPESGTSAGLLF